MLPSLPMVLSWQPASAGSTAAAAITAAADDLDTSASNATDSMARLGGAWSGSGYDGARDHMDRLHGHIGAISGSLDGLATTVSQSLDQLDTARTHLLSVVGQAMASGMLVTSRWQVIPLIPSPASIAIAAIYQAAVYEALAGLVNADIAAATAITTSANSVAAGGGPHMQRAVFPLVAAAVAAVTTADIAAIVAGAAAAGAAVAGVAALYDAAKDGKFTFTLLPELLLPAIGSALGPLYNAMKGEAIPDDEARKRGLPLDGPGTWKEGSTEGVSERAKEYEKQITGTDGETTYEVPLSDGNTYQADGYDPECSALPEDERNPNGCLQEAKGPGYAHMLDKDWFKGRHQLHESLKKLSDAARMTGTTGDMAVAEEEVAEMLREFQESNRGLANVRIRVEAPK